MTRAQFVDSYYKATANPSPERPALKGAVSADVCVVGGGFTGVSTALNLAEKGYSVVLLEAERIGWGASGRNGGHVGTGFASGQEKIEKWVGKADSKKLWDCCEEAKQIIRDRVEKHAIACDLKWGYLHAAPKPRHLEDLREEQAHWAEYGYEKGVRLVEGEELRQHCNSGHYAGGLLDEGAGQIHPLNYCLGLAEAAEAAGATLHDDSRVTSIEGDSGVRELKLLDNDGNPSSLAVEGVFILIGITPNNSCLPLELLKADKWGFIPVDTECRTVVPGVMAAGDIISKNVRQVVNAAGEGAVAMLSAEAYLNKLKEKKIGVTE